MKEKMKMLLELIVLAVIIYLIGCFAQADLNIKNWNATFRGATAIIYGIISLCILPIKIINVDETK